VILHPTAIPIPTSPATKWERGKSLLILFFALSSFALLLKTSLAGGRDADSRFGDFRFLFNSGTTWLNGESPYDISRYQYYWLRDIETLPDRPYAAKEPQAKTPEDLSGRTIMYPYFPNSAWLTVPLRALGWSGAKIVISVFNLASVVALALLMASLLHLRSNGRLLLLGGTCLASATSATIFTGQLSLVSTAGALLCVWAASKDRPFLAATGAALAFLKPQLTVFLVIVGLLHCPRRSLSIVSTAILVGLTNLLPIALIRDVDFLSSFRASLALRSTHPFNYFSNMDGLYYVLSHFLGDGSVSFVALLTGLLATWVAAKKLSFPAAVLAVSVISSICLPVHVGYDLVIVLPVLMLPFLTNRRSWLQFTALFLVVLTLRFPTLLRVLSKLHLPDVAAQPLLLGLLSGAVGLAAWVGRAHENTRATGAVERATASHDA
jgi:hypothetical protein